jgi:ATP-GRASP peptide maturase of grasp-with-spasm system
MILIISSSVDHTTTKILRWLQYSRTPFLRINGEDNISFLNIENNEISITCSNHIIKLSQIKAVWYRREGFNFNFDFIVSDNLKDIDSAVTKHFTICEQKDVEAYIHYRLQQIPHLSSYLTASVNKLSVLYEAQKLGLKIPNTLITTDGTSLSKFINKYDNNVINKSIGSSNTFLADGKDWGLYTNTVKEGDFTPNETFFPSKFQNTIQKKYEIRTFIMDSKFYSMAIFSQKNNRTKIDFRKYDWDQPNRNVPFKLPDEIESRLLKLLKKFKLDCASIDLIVDEKNDFIFLEINPVGQFGMVSIPCNYFLDKKVAEFLKNKMETANI